jgi:hypothetical protein
MISRMRANRAATSRATRRRFGGRAEQPLVAAGRRRYGWPHPSARRPHLQTPASRLKAALAAWQSSCCRHHIEGNDTMTSQAMTPHRTSPLSHAFSFPVVRELPSLPSAALGSAQTW